METDNKITPQYIKLIDRFLIWRNVPNSPTGMHSLLCRKYETIMIANEIASCLE